MTASAKTCITSHSGSILSRNGYGLYTNPFRGFGRGRVRFQFDDPTYDPRGNWYHSGAQWVQVSTSPNIWDYWREATDWNFEFGGVSYDSQARIKSPCAILIANLEGITDIGYIFQLCTNIHDIYNFYAPDVTNVQHAFDTCANLETCEILSLGSATSFYRLFGGCRSMEKAPFFDFAPTVTDVSDMFDGCTSLIEVPLYDTSHITHFGGLGGGNSGMFMGCTSLEHVPFLDTSSAVWTACMFMGCTSLKNIPLFNTSNVSNMRNMFTNCHALERVPLFDTSKVKNMQQMFYRCEAIETVPLFDTSKVSDFQGMLFGCTSLKHIPLFDTSSCDASGYGYTSCNAMCSGCVSVESGALALYNQWITQSEGHPYPSTQYQNTFKNCGVNTVSGLNDLQQIPTSWGGLKEE